MIIDLEAADAGCGGKAAGLARAAALGVSVPPGVVLTGALFEAVVGVVPRAVPIDDRGAALARLADAAAHATVADEVRDAVTAAVAPLGDRLVVRASLRLEDTVAGAAPGVSTSVVDVAPAALWSAIRTVWSSAWTPLVAAYARARGGDELTAPAVIVQRYVVGFRAVVYTRPPGRPDLDEVWIACGVGAPERVSRAGERWRDAVAVALAAERAIDAAAGADVELVWSIAHARWELVQVRPLVHPPPRAAKVPPPPIVAAQLADRAWRRDVTHNPAPLSVAQAELCARVEEAAIAPFHLRVVAHHLYVAPRDPAVPRPRVTSATALAAELAERERALAAVLATPAADLDGAVAQYLKAYQLLAAEIGPRVHAALAVLPAALVARGGSPHAAAALTPARPSSVAARLAACARGQIDRPTLLAAIGDVATAWDVMAPTFAELPAQLDAALARAALRPVPPPSPPPPPGLDDEVAIAAIAVDAAERDDLGYWRAQAIVRRALLGVADRHGIDRADVFWLPFARLLDGATLDPIAARGHAAAARAAAARCAAWDLDPTPSPPTLRGVGVGGRARGPVVHVDPATPVHLGAIAVVRAVTPALALVLDGVAALVVETGSPLDHGAAMARELGVPCVVGCAGAVAALAPGTWVAVDGDGGSVAIEP